LLEQILDSHPQVFGVGEHRLLGELMDEIIAGEHGLEKFSKMQPEKIKNIGKLYVEQLRKLAPKNTRFITNKMLSNYYYVGFIRTILPKAKIIHTMRNPIDSCFSCFGRMFVETMNFTYSLKEVGEYYRRYMQLMEHWHTVVPSEYLLDVSYENLVKNFEVETKRVLDFIGLPWSDKCLSFHENTRRVETASIGQVHKPLYQSSAHRGNRFLPYLGELQGIVSDHYDQYNDKVNQWCRIN